MINAKQKLLEVSVMKSIKLQIFVVILLSFGELCNQNNKVALRLPKESRTIFFFIFIHFFICDKCSILLVCYNLI